MNNREQMSLEEGRLSSIMATVGQDAPAPDQEFLNRLKEKTAAVFVAEGQKPVWARIGTSSRLLKWLVPAAAAACVVLVTMLSAGPATPTWAQVAERFAAVKTFSATVHYRQNALSEAVSAEFWMGAGGRMRATGDNQVLFAEKGKETRAFDIKNRKEATEDKTSIATTLLNTVSGRETFGLDTIVDIFSGGVLKDVTPTVSGQASVAEDLVVYDIQVPRTPKWCRIWALRKSRLPVQIVLWDPRDGGRVDVAITYGPEPPAAFFDAGVFAKRLVDRSIPKQTLPYIDLVDTGGNNYVPSPPQYDKAVDVVTPTLDGKPWSLKDRLGKVTLLHVWQPPSANQEHMLDHRYLMELYETYGKRDDFQLVTLVIFDDAEQVRKMKADLNVPWPFLFDGKGWGGDLVRAVGGPQHPSYYLVDRQGHIREISDLADPRVMEVEVVGPTYDNYFPLRMRFDEDIRAGRLTAETVRSIFGQPDERVESPSGPQHERWVYVRRNKSQEQERRVFVDVDVEKGIVTELSSSRRILDPARLTLTVTPEYWKEKVLPRLAPEYRPDADRADAYRIALYAESGSVSQDLGKYGGPDFAPGTYTVELVHGTGQLVLRVWRRRGKSDGGIVSSLVIQDGIALELGATTKVTLE